MILLADTPSLIVRMALAGKPIHSCIYLGKDDGLLGRWRRNLPVDCKILNYARVLNEVSDEKRALFVEWIDAVSDSGQASAEWFFSVPSVKNPNNSDLFLHVCYFFTMKRLFKDGIVPDVVIVDSPALAKCLKLHFPQLGGIFWGNFIAEVLVALKGWARAAARLVLNTFQLLQVFIAARAVLKKRAVDLLRGSKDIVLIRNYITGSFKDGRDDAIEKKFFPGLYDYLEGQGKIPVFLPIAVQIKDFKRLFTKIAQSERRIIFVEEFLKCSDYLYLIFAPMRALTYRIKAPELDGFNLSGLIAEEYYGNVTEHGFLLAVICSCFGKRLKEAKINPADIVNWSEYQAFEKGLLGGLRKEFPSIKIIAAHAFCIPPNHLCLIPSRQDKVLNILPDRSLVLGPVGKDIISQYLKELPVMNSPLFRYGSVYQPHELNDQANDVLVLFGFSFANALHSLKLLVGLSKTLKIFRKVFIKLHPLANFNDQTLLKALDEPLPENFQFIGGNLEEHLKTVVIGICGATGTAVELAVRGIPVIMIAETQTLTMNYLAYRTDADLWRLCFGQEELDLALKYFHELRTKHPQRLKNAAQMYLQAYFAPGDQAYFQHFI